MEERAHGAEGVVRDLAGPHEIPERREHLRREGARVPGELREEGRAPLREMRADALVLLAVDAARLGDEEPGVFGERERDLAVARPDGARAVPDHLPRGDEGIEIARVVIEDARRQHTCLEVAGGDRSTLQPLDRVEQRRLTAPGPVYAMPADEQAAEGRGLDRFDLATEPCERALPQRAEDVRLAPLEPTSTGPVLPFHERACSLETPERVEHRGG